MDLNPDSPTSSIEFTLSGSDAINIKNLIQDALTFKLEQVKKKRSKNELDNALRVVTSEFLNSFIIFGYDMEGKPVLDKVADTIQREEALKSLLHKVFSNEMQNDYDIDEDDL